MKVFSLKNFPLYNIIYITSNAKFDGKYSRPFLSIINMKFHSQVTGSSLQSELGYIDPLHVPALFTDIPLMYQCTYAVCQVILKSSLSLVHISLARETKCTCMILTCNISYVPRSHDLWPRYQLLLQCSSCQLVPPTCMLC